MSRASALLILVLMSVTCLNIVGRVFSKALPGVYEATEFLLVGIVFLALAFTQYQGAHIGVDVVIERVPRSWQHWLLTVTLFLSLVIFGIIFWSSADSAYVAWKINDRSMGIVPIPSWPAKAMIPLGSFFLCLRLAIQILKPKKV